MHVDADLLIQLERAQAELPVPAGSPRAGAARGGAGQRRAGSGKRTPREPAARSGSSRQADTTAAGRPGTGADRPAGGPGPEREASGAPATSPALPRPLPPDPAVFEAVATAGGLRSALTPREIQARLRQGRTVTEVAAEAGVGIDWIDRFAAPILAEQRAAVDRAGALRFTTARKGESALPLADAVQRNLLRRGIRVTADEIAEHWSAWHTGGSEWVVRLEYAGQQKSVKAEWLVDFAERTLSARSPLAAQLAFVEDISEEAQPAGTEGAASTPAGTPSEKGATADDATDGPGATDSPGDTDGHAEAGEPAEPPAGPVADAGGDAAPEGLDAEAAAPEAAGPEAPGPEAPEAPEPPDAGAPPPGPDAAHRPAGGAAPAGDLSGPLLATRTAAPSAQLPLGFEPPAEPGPPTAPDPTANGGTPNDGARDDAAGPEPAPGEAAGEAPALPSRAVRRIRKRG